MHIRTFIAEKQLGVGVGKVSAGACVRFLSPFHQDCKPGARYIVNWVVESYRPHRGDSNLKVGVTNLNDGKLSYVEGTRKVILLKEAEVITNET